MQKKRLQSQNDDKKTERDKLFAEQRTIKDSIKGPSNLQVRVPSLHTPLYAGLVRGAPPCLAAAAVRGHHSEHHTVGVCGL